MSEPLVPLIRCTMNPPCGKCWYCEQAANRPKRCTWKCRFFECNRTEGHEDAHGWSKARETLWEQS